MARGTLSNPFKQRGQTLGGQALDFFTGGGLKGKALGITSISEGVRSRRSQRELEMSQAEARLEEGMQGYQDFEFQTVNPYETMTVNLQAAEFQREQQAQEQADILQSLRGGSGIGSAALATSLMRSSTAKQQQIAADIAQQEQEIKMASAQAEIANQQAEQRFDIGRMETMLGMRMAEVTGLEQAEQARKDRNAQLAGSIIGGVTSIASAAI